MNLLKAAISLEWSVEAGIGTDGSVSQRLYGPLFFFEGGSSSPGFMIQDSGFLVSVENKKNHEHVTKLARSNGPNCDTNLFTHYDSTVG